MLRASVSVDSFPAFLPAPFFSKDRMLREREPELEFSGDVAIVRGGNPWTPQSVKQLVLRLEVQSWLCGQERTLQLCHGGLLNAPRLQA